MKLLLLSVFAVGLVASLPAQDIAGPPQPEPKCAYVIRRAYELLCSMISNDTTTPSTDVPDQPRVTSLDQCCRANFTCTPDMLRQICYDIRQKEKIQNNNIIVIS